MKKKLKKRESKKSTKIDSVYSFYNDVEKLHAKVKVLELGKYAPLVLAVETLKQKVLNFVLCWWLGDDAVLWNGIFFISLRHWNGHRHRTV
jgi:hypothetical protein